MRNSEKLPPAAAAVEYVPEDYFVPFEFNLVFERRAPVEIDVGCGDGAFLAALAAQEPERNFLGIERLLGRVRSVCRKIAERRIGNVRVLRVESSYAIRYLLPPRSVAVFHINFPDPWPKRRHQQRRIIGEGFLDSIRLALLPNGLLRIATDQLDYFTEIRRILNQMPGFAIEPVLSERELPTTTFEKRFRERRQKIHRLALRKVSEVR